MSHPRILALIPARGGSKGIPRKNLAPLAGRPLLAWTIEHARQTPEIDRVVVTTDDAEIASVARREGAETVERPAELAGDAASSESALIHALDVLRERDGDEPDLVVFLQATSPRRRTDDVSNALALFERQKADSLFSAARLEGFVWRREDEDSAPRSLTYDFENRPRRQDIGEDFLENGSFYVFKPQVLRQTGHRLGGRIAVYPMDPHDSFQVDEPADLELLERLFLLDPPRRAPAVPDLSGIRLLVLDFDGVMTDNTVIVHQDGHEAVRCSRGDGLGLEHLRQAGEVEIVVLSKERNPVVRARCEKLGLECHHGYDDKLPHLQKLAATRGLGPEAVAYVGNDLNDLDAMAWSGVGIAVADAVPEILRVADWTTRNRG